MVTSRYGFTVINTHAATPWIFYEHSTCVAPHGYRLITPLTGEDAYYALAVKTKDADTLITALEQAGLKVKTFADDQPF
ncbi:hypothetical protein [Marinobacterium sp. BA1]|uniref:hypothetical protein n=1 Tax=Marinobacterium sp. BA1 TaxID=3138931 RepID=UPI0032E682B9